MDDSFEIPVLYKGEELLFNARLLAVGYVHKFQVDVFGQELFFEQDDSGEYHLHCPTTGCPGAPQDWFHHGVGRASADAIASRTVAMGFGLVSL